MQNYKFNNVTLQANSKQEAAQKLAAVLSLAANFDLQTLQALQAKGPEIFNGPQGPMVRGYLGL